MIFFSPLVFTNLWFFVPNFIFLRKWRSVTRTLLTFTAYLFRSSNQPTIHWGWGPSTWACNLGFLPSANQLKFCHYSLTTMPLVTYNTDPHCSNDAFTSWRLVQLIGTCMHSLAGGNKCSCSPVHIMGKWHTSEKEWGNCKNSTWMKLL